MKEEKKYKFTTTGRNDEAGGGEAAIRALLQVGGKNEYGLAGCNNKGDIYYIPDERSDKFAPWIGVCDRTSETAIRIKDYIELNNDLLYNEKLTVIRIPTKNLNISDKFMVVDSNGDPISELKIYIKRRVIKDK